MSTLCVIAYLCLAFLCDPSVWLHGPSSHLFEAGNWDVDEGVWFLASTPWAIVHHVNPFDNNWLEFPRGVDLMDNTTMPLLGLLAAPVTFLWGPVLSFNLLVVASFAGSATAAFFALGRWVSWMPARFIGGLVYGFSPYMAAVANGHLMILMVPLPPLVLVTMDQIVLRRTRSAWREGLLLGFLLVAQLFISAEVLSSLMVMMAAGLGILAVHHFVSRSPLARRRIACISPSNSGSYCAADGSGSSARPRALDEPGDVRQPGIAKSGHHDGAEGLEVRGEAPRMRAGLGYVMKAFGTAALVLVLFGAYPAWVALKGPAHIVGPAQSPTLLEGLSTDLYTPVIPTVDQRFSFDEQWVGTDLVGEHVGSRFFPDGSENGGYLGAPLLVVLIVGAIALWRRREMRFAIAMAVVSLIISMGAVLHIDGRFVGLRLPFAVLFHLPVFDSEIASRYTLFMWIFVAMAIALMAELAHQRLSSWSSGRIFASTSRRRASRRRPLATAVVLAGALVALLPLVPAWPYGWGSASVPKWFTSPGLSQVPEGSTLLTYPFPYPGSPQAMLWQAVAKMRFRMPGGYLIVPGKQGLATFTPPQTLTSDTLVQCAAGGSAPPNSDLVVKQVRSDLQQWKVDTVVVLRNETGWGCAVSFLSGAIGPPEVVDGADVWTNLYAELQMDKR